jgi:signal transduction histidine kinase/DNA-binding LacI/PurR family transcriptional regulator
MAGPRPVIGMVMASLVDLYQVQWLGAVDAARARGASLVTFVGRELGQPKGFEARANAVYDLVSAERLDGLVIWTTSLAQFVGRRRMEEFCARFGDLPLVSLERSLPGIPSLVMDDRNGMKAAVTHLIEVHGHRRIAFVRGSEHHLGAQERYQGYLEALAEHGLPVDHDLVSAPSGQYSAELAGWVERLVTDPARRPAAIVSAHDDWALGVLSVLKACGVAVPQEVAVVGFDDVIGVRRHGLWLEGTAGPDTLALVDLQAAMMPLTTVRAPFRELGEQAIESLVTRLGGGTVPDVVTLPTRLIVRHSCGCTPTRRQSEPQPVRVRPVEVVEQLAAAMASSVSSPPPELPPDWALRLARAFDADVRGETPGAFLAAFDALARGPALRARSLLTWFGVIAALREAARLVVTGEAAVQAESLWPRIQALIEQMAERFSSYHGLWIEKDNEIVRRLGQKVIGALDVRALADVLARELPSVGIATCYLAAYADGAARSLLAYERGARLELAAGDEIFPSTLLVPGGRLFADEPRSVVVLPLYFKTEQLGFVLFELGPRTGWIYEALQEQLSSGLEAALLVEREQAARAGLQQARDELEERVEQRTAELARANEILTEEMIARARAEETRTNLESQLRLAQKMEALGRLAGGIAHDFNNLLLVINGYSDLVLAELPPDNPLRNDVDQIRHAGEQAATLTSQLLAFGRKQILEPRVLGLNDVVVEVETMLRRLIGEDVELVTRLDPSLPQIRADRGQIEQVIVNLAVNARDAMPGGGRLTIATANEEPSVLLTVSDTGLGMDPETQARVFEPFFTTKDQGGGTGLGLATVFGIVEQSGGHIDVESRPNEGTTFRVSLPRAAPPSPEGDSGRRAVPAESGSETILLVEDEPSVRGALRRFLEQHGYDVLDAPGSSEALSLFEEHADSIDLVVTDVVMPETSGPELMDRLTSIRPGLPVLYVSGYTGGVIGRQGLSDETVALLEKPFTAEALGLKVRELLDRRER